MSTMVDQEILCSNRRNNFFTLDNQLYDSGLARLIKPNGVAIYAYLTRLCGDRDVCWPHQNTIAEVVGISVRSVKRAIGDLKTYKLLSVKKTSSGNRYELNSVSEATCQKQPSVEFGPTQGWNLAPGQGSYLAPPITKTQETNTQEEERAHENPVGATGTHKIPDDWWPSVKTVQWMTDSGVSEENQNSIVLEFRLYWSTRGDRRKNWDLVFQRNPRVKGAIATAKLSRTRPKAKAVEDLELEKRLRGAIN